MCGICGFTDYKNDYLLGAMAASLRHRGPDEDGFHYDGGRASLASRRLRIIDLDTGRQPVSNEDGTVTVVFNGEIYNYRELREELRRKGHSFRTSSDTEVLVHLYEERGTELCSALRGMFAFALWDSGKGRLLLARDQFGIKPLYYAETGGSLFFASELKALLLCDRISRDLDPVALDAYFTLLRIPAPLTAFRAVKKLESGCLLVREGGRSEIKRYWDLRPEFPAETGGALRERLLAAFDESVREQLVSDVPLGLLLSGGLDSSAIAYSLGAAGAPVTAFSAGFSGADSAYDETRKAALAASAFGLRHERLEITADAAEVCTRLAEGFDEPFADSSAIPTYLVTRAASGKVKAALTGIGGDELFGGYPRHLGALHLRKYLMLPRPLRSAAAGAAGLLWESRGPRNLAGWAKRFTKGGLLDFPKAYHYWCTFLDEKGKNELYSLDFRTALSGSRYAPPFLPPSPDEIMRYELGGYLQDDLLALADRVSMMNSLELRVPFLDVRLAALTAGVTLSEKTGGGLEPKRLMRRMLAGRLPAELLSQRKMGFQAPVSRWLAEDLAGFMDDALSPRALERSGYLDSSAVARLRGDHLSGRRDHSDRLYSVLMFELWLRSLKGPAAAVSALPVSSPRDFEKILLLNLGGLGDIVMMRPLLLALRSRFPAAKITLLTLDRSASAARLLPELDAVESLAVRYKLPTPLAALRGLLTLLRLRKERFPLLLNQLAVSSPWGRRKLRFLNWILEPGFSAGRCIEDCPGLYDAPIYEREVEDRSEVDLSLRLLEPLGLRPAGRNITFPVPPEDSAWADAELCRRGLAGRFLIGLNPGSFRPSRRWPLERWLELARRMRARYPEAGFVVTTGPGEEKLSEALGSGERTWTPGGALSAGQLAALLAKLSVYVTNDTGPMHLAAAVGTRVAAIFGPSDIVRFTPAVPRAMVRVVRADSAGCFRPCYDFECADPRCLSDITPEAVLEAVEALRGGK